MALSSQTVFFYKAAWSLRSDCVLAAVSGAGSVKPDRMAANWLWLCCGGLIGVFSLKTAF